MNQAEDGVADGLDPRSEIWKRSWLAERTIVAVASVLGARTPVVLTWVAPSKTWPSRSVGPARSPVTLTTEYSMRGQPLVETSTHDVPRACDHRLIQSRSGFSVGVVR